MDPINPAYQNNLTKDMDCNFQICRRCNKNLPIDAFNTHGHNKSGISYYCKECYSDMRNKVIDDNLLNDRTNALELLQRIGYDPTRNIHEQFIEKHFSK